MRTSFGQYPEYHTSADNLEFVKPESLADSWRKCAAIVEILEHDRTYLNQNPKGEPQLGRAGCTAPWAENWTARERKRRCCGS